MEINDYSRTNQNSLYKTAVSEYEASFERLKNTKAADPDEKQAPVISHEGQVIRGEVVDLRYQEIKIRLEPGGQVISGKISGDVPLYIGQIAEFEISDKTGDVIALRYLPAGSTPMNDIIHKALYASGLSLSEKNIAIVQELLNYGMPVDKKTLLQMIKLTATYPGTSIKNLVLMLKNQLPINPASVAQMESYRNGTHQILTELKELLGHITDSLKNTDLDFSTESAKDSGTLIGKSPTILTDNGNIPENINGTDSDTRQSMGNAAENIQVAENLKDELLPAESTFKSDSMLLGLKELLSVLHEEDNLAASYAPGLPIGQIFSEDEFSNIKDVINKLIDKTSDGQTDNNLNTVTKQLNDGTLTLKDFLRLTFDLYESGHTGLYKDNPAVSGRILEAFVRISDKLTAAENEKLVNVLKESHFDKFIEEEFHRRWTLDPDNLKEEIISKKYFRRLYEDLEKLKDLSNNNKLFDTQAIKASIEKLQDNLQFMGDLNELFFFLQLPMRLTNQDAHGDLYVFTRKYKASHNTDDPISAILHLNMKNLGTVDVHLTLKNRQVNAVFYLEESSAQLISGHIHMLSDSLYDKGFKLQVKTVASGGKPDLINDLLSQGSNLGKTVNRFSFDIRA